MRFGKKAEQSAEYRINNVKLDFVNSYKDLGVIIDTSLKFHDHIRTVVGRMGGLLNDLLRSTVCRSRNFMLPLFLSHIRPGL